MPEDGRAAQDERQQPSARNEPQGAEPSTQRASASAQTARSDAEPPPAAPWTELASPEPPPATPASTLRDRLRVPSDRVTVHTDPLILPEQAAETGGLFELASPIARRALELGLLAREPSFHVYVAADPDMLVENDVVHYAERLARERAATAPPPPDVVYVHDFDHPEAPVPLVLPAGVAQRLADAVAACVATLKEQLPGLGESEPVREAHAALGRELEARNREVLSGLEITAKTLGFGVRSVQGGVQTYPILHGKPLTAEQFEALDETTKRALGQAEQRLTQEVERSAERVQEAGERFAEARKRAMAVAARAIAEQAAEPLGELASHGPEVARWLEQVKAALVHDWEDFLDESDEEAHKTSTAESADEDPEYARRLGRFRVNLFVSHDASAPPPVVYDTNPTYPHLFGYLERRMRFGALLTDFSRIRAGSLQRASGGVLVVRAADVLADPIIWERLKRVLRERRIGAEDPLGPLGLYATSLRPVPAPIRVRVVLVGSQELYAALLASDPDFASLFRVKVEVEPTIARREEGLRRLDAYLMAMAREREWGRFDRGARARLLDLATRLAGHQEKLALSLSPLEETAAFASAIATARVTGAHDPGAHQEEQDESRPRFRASIPPPSMTLVTAEDIESAWRERRDRAGAAERMLRELTLRGEVVLDLVGARVGVVNGLSVFFAGDVEFGQPMRITAVVALGREGIVDVEHEAQLGGAIHTKGVAILRGYLGRMFGQERPLSLRAQLAIEQSYGEVDGDSASSSELFAVLSSLAELPIDQSVGVTGSVNQLGELQAIGGVCAKIEGFFDLCAARGLTGNQAVMLPRANVAHLVLRQDVARAIQEGTFHLYAVDDVAQGIELLTGVPAGERDEAGRFPASSVFGRVERRLIEIAERLREAEGHVRHHDARDDSDVSQSDLSDATDFRVR